jgi:hypothetical protein
MTTKFERETYLGDGIYASFDGWYIILRALRDDGNYWVAFEPQVLSAFIDYVDKIQAQ